jgi:CHAD domain-containing protein
VPPSLHEGLDLLFARFAGERAAEQRALARWLSGEEYDEEMQNLARLFSAGRWPERGPNADRPVEQLAHELIGRRWRKARACAKDIDASTPDEVVHDLRIRCKKLRYLLEFFAPLIGEHDLGPLIRPLRRLQDELGLFNDYSVQIRALEGVLASRQARGNDDIAIARSLGAVIAVLHQRQVAQRRRVENILDDFTGPKVRRRFEGWIERGAA